MVVGQGFEPWKAMPTDLQALFRISWRKGGKSFSALFYRGGMRFVILLALLFLTVVFRFA
jgi:hypothetical protein